MRIELEDQTNKQKLVMFVSRTAQAVFVVQAENLGLLEQATDIAKALKIPRMFVITKDELPEFKYELLKEVHVYERQL